MKKYAVTMHWSTENRDQLELRIVDAISSEEAFGKAVSLSDTINTSDSKGITYNLSLWVVKEIPNTSTNNYDSYRFRTCDSIKYLIPVDLTDKFDTLTEDFNEDNAEQCGLIDDNFAEYRVGDLQDLELYLKQ
jgi:hypothetical protein